ncbi:MAG: aminotransferase class V-fold PLP-dependent enzyme [Devosia sp.]|uniref:aminotransferase class V-fold PLP-dependent enzyme n=1 Tax=Devosia sp. TaxID=1871048 RepID=UPI0024C55072|nr:aminotransferase class V-fold PLP-dependent enzyme [Devosia sp.]UYN99054.1 MAG: aminotransferase class V-fold PLP-dependent enzyme [Devosia sp.]
MSDNLAHHFLLRDDVVFLNHGSFGACPRPVFAAYQGWQLELEREPVEFLGRRLHDLLRVPRQALAAELGCGSEDIVGVLNATTGLNIVAQSLDLKPGDQILTTDHEYSALEKTWAYVCQKTGAEIVVIEVPLPLTSEAAFTGAIVAGMTERTKVLFLSHITSPTALLFPIAASIAEARKRGIVSVIDGAHTPGHIRLDLDSLGADYYSGNCHKWMMAPKGSAFLHARPEMQGRLNPLVISHGWTAQSRLPDARGAFGNSPFIDEIEIQGTRDPAPWLTVPDALAFREEQDWWAISDHCRHLAQATARRMAALTGLAPLSSPEFSAPQMVAMPIPECDTAEIHRRLFDDYGIEIPVFRWRDTCIARLSVQGYNSAPQMDRLVAALSELLKLEVPARLAQG